MAIFLDQSALGGANGRTLPAGGMMYFAGAGAPSGYLIRDGSSVPVATYPNLFAVIGYTYGGGGANFNLPDDLGLCLAGSGLGTAVPGLTAHALGAVGGSETHTLLTAELAIHTHLQNAHTHLQDAHTHLQDAHDHTDSFTVVQDAHTHIQDAHTHTQNAHTHTQDAHSHQIDVGNVVGNSGIISVATNGIGTINTRSQTATNQNSTATNQNATATNQNATATNQATSITTDQTTATNQNTTATNQNTTAVNQNEGSSTPFNIIQPTRYYTPCIAY